MIAPAGSLLDPAVFGFGALAWFIASLQPAVAGYALRLNRNFGTQRVGWWLFVAFCLLALSHLMQRSQIFPGQSSTQASVILELLLPLLLLIGMAHTETVFVSRLRVERNQRALVLDLESKAQEKTAALCRENDNLLDEIARERQRHKTLQDSEREYRLLFANIPQPIWVFDLRSFRILAVNNSALSQYGFSPEEFLARSACELLPPEDVPAFLQDAAQPACGLQSPGLWRHRTKHGALLNVETTVVDLRFAGCPARLILARNLTAHH